MANGSMEVEHIRPATQGIPSSIRIQQRCYGVPIIKITHVFDESKIFQTRSGKERSADNVTFKIEGNQKTSKMSNARTCVKCNFNDNANQRVSCADNCLSLMLPLEVELNVLGVVDQGMLDRGEMAKIRRVGNHKRNSAPDISVETLPAAPQKSRPRSFTTASDLTRMLNRQSLQSTTLCSTEL